MINKQQINKSCTNSFCFSLVLFIDEVPGIISDTFMSVPTEKAMVRKQKLQEAVGDSTWRINNSLDKKYKHCSPRVIVKEALMEVGKMMEYSIYSSNCEHFVNELRYGKAVSWQVSGPILFFSKARLFLCLG